jgi:hypothetical protein
MCTAAVPSSAGEALRLLPSVLGVLAGADPAGQPAAATAEGLRLLEQADAVTAAVRGRYLAAFQYAFTVPGVIAPAMVALYSVAAWLPWLLVGASAGLAVLLLYWLASRLPASALHPGPVVPQVTARDAESSAVLS